MTPSQEILGTFHRQNHIQRYKFTSPTFATIVLIQRGGGRKQLLVSEGFEVVNISLVPRHTPLIGGILEWLRLFTKNTTFFQGIDLDETEAILGEVANVCEVDNKDMDSDGWMMLYVRLRVLAKRL